MPDDDLVRLTSAARAAGRSWSAIAATCGVRVRQDTCGVITQPGGIGAETAAALLFLGTGMRSNSSPAATATTWIPPGPRVPLPLWAA